MWRTEDECDFLNVMGPELTANPYIHSSRLVLLRRYCKNIDNRTCWEGMDKDAIREHCLKLIAEELK